MFTELEKEIPFLIKNLGKALTGYSIKDGVMLIEVPGFTKEDLKINLEGYIIHVKGKKEILGEIFEIDSKFVLPAGSLNSDDPITAKVENGLLFINLKKSKRAKQTTVDIS
jgi:HSP20 family molecular chaperone IbpA